MPDTATFTRSRAGLFTTTHDAVSLTGVSVEADISNLCARVVVAQRYVNTEDEPIEAVYLFPLDEGAAVCGFEALVDGTRIVGEVKPREEAFEAYDDAMARGDGAFLLDEERPDVFQASVGNLPPGKEVVLRLTYVTELSVDEGAVRFVIPTTVSPRYAPPEDRVGIGRPDAQTLNAPMHLSVPYGLDLTVRVGMHGGVRGIASPSHPVAVSLEGERATVTLSQQDTALDRDFVLALDAASLAAPQAWIERTEDGSRTAAIAFVPTLSDAPAPAEVVFVVDRSGSMMGDSIEEVRNALQLCLRSLRAGCAFNIIGFGSCTQPLFDGSRAYDEDSLQEASAHVAAMQADLGGTEILDALRLALEAPRHGNLPRQVVVLTDGGVSNTDAALALARSHAAHARIFTFGIGAGASHHLVKGLARAGGGHAEFIYPGERIEPKVMRQLRRLLGAWLTNVRVDWGGLDVTQTPSVVPPLFAGGRLVLYGPLREQPGTDAATDAPTDAATDAATNAATIVRLVADGLDGQLSFDVPIDASRAETGNAVAILAARTRIRELEESAEWETRRGSRQRERTEASVTREIVELAVRHGLMSRETSYVAIERRETPVEGEVRLRRVPIALAAGWGGLGSVRGSIAVNAQPLPAASAWSSWAIFSKCSVEMPSISFDQTPESAFAELSSMDYLSEDSRSAAPASNPDPLYTLIALQRADGSWDLTDELVAVLDDDWTRLEGVLRELGRAGADARAELATRLALDWLQREASDREDEWRMLADKARAWLAGVAPPSPPRPARRPAPATPPPHA